VTYFLHLFELLFLEMLFLGEILLFDFVRVGHAFASELVTLLQRLNAVLVELAAAVGAESVARARVFDAQFVRRGASRERLRGFALLPRHLLVVHEHQVVPLQRVRRLRVVGSAVAFVFLLLFVLFLLVGLVRFQLFLQFVRLALQLFVHLVALALLRLFQALSLLRRFFQNRLNNNIANVWVSYIYTYIKAKQN